MPNQSFSQNQDLSKEIKLKDTTLIVTTLRSHSDICAIMCYNPVRVPIWSCLFLSLWGIWGTITPEKCSKSFIYPEVKQGLYMLLIGSRSTHPPNEWKRTLRQLTSPDLSNWSCLSSPHVHCLLCYALYTFSATSFFFLPLRDFRHTTFNWNLWIIFFRCRQEKIWNHTALLSTPLQEKNPNNHPRKLRIWEQARQLTPDACDAARQEIFPAFEGV